MERIRVSIREPIESQVQGSFSEFNVGERITHRMLELDHFPAKKKNGTLKIMCCAEETEVENGKPTVWIKSDDPRLHLDESIAMPRSGISNEIQNPGNCAGCDFSVSDPICAILEGYKKALIQRAGEKL